MRKYVILLFLMIMIMVAGCSSNSDEPTVIGDNGSKQPVVKQSEPNSLRSSDVQEVKLSRSLQFGIVNKADLGVFSERAVIDIFIDAIHSAKKIEGKLDIRRPDYDVTVLTKDATQSIHLWLGTDRDVGMYTLVSDTGTGYTLTEGSASSLKQLIMNISYTSEQAGQNGDIVNIHGIKFINLDKWDTFLTNIQSKKRDQVQVTSYTIEGDPIFYNLNYEG